MFDHYSVFKINSEVEFNSKALELYKIQSVQCPIYKKFISIINRPEPKSYQEIPFLPISFFEVSIAIWSEPISSMIIFKIIHR